MDSERDYGINENLGRLLRGIVSNPRDNTAFIEPSEMRRIAVYGLRGAVNAIVATP